MSYDIYDLKTILNEMRTYDPRADEYGGKRIIPGWAERLEVAVSRINAESREFASLAEERRQFILNGVEMGYIRLPTTPDPASATYKRCLAGSTGKCQKCSGTGMTDSGGVQPWGEPILIPCDCEITSKGKAA